MLLDEDNITMFTKICTHFSKLKNKNNQFVNILKIVFKKQLPKSIFFTKKIKKILESDYLEQDNEIKNLLNEEDQIIDSENKEKNTEKKKQKTLIKTTNIKANILQLILIHSILNKISKTIMLKQKQILLKKYKINNGLNNSQEQKR